jgi:hypothetical protein
MVFITWGAPSDEGVGLLSVEDFSLMYSWGYIGPMQHEIKFDQQF